MLLEFLIISALFYLLKPKLSIFPLILLFMTRERAAYFGSLILTYVFSGNLIITVIMFIINEILNKLNKYRNMCVSKMCYLAIPLVLVTAYYTGYKVLIGLLLVLIFARLCYRKEALGIDLLAPGFGLIYSSFRPTISAKGDLKVVARLTPFVFFDCLHRKRFYCWKRVEGKYEINSEKILVIGSVPITFENSIEIGEGEKEFGKYGLGVGKSVREVMELVSFISKLYSLTPAQKERLSELLMEKYLKKRKINELIMMARDNVIREIIKEVGYVIGDEEVDGGGIKGELNDVQKKVLTFLLTRSGFETVIVHEDLKIKGKRVVVRANTIPENVDEFEVVVFGRGGEAPEEVAALLKKYENLFVIWDRKKNVLLAVVA